MVSKRTRAAKFAWIAYGAILVVIGVALVVPGIKLITLGGSFYYLIAGAATILAGILLAIGRRSGALVYAAMLIGTALWALWEVGLDGWALVPRLVAPLVLGIPLGIAALSWRWRGRTVAMICAAVLVLAAGSFMLLLRAEKPLAPSELSEQAAPLAASDWQHYGYGQGGSRHSPAAQITPQNVGRLEVAWTRHVDQPMNGLLKARFSVSPLEIGGLLYVCTGLNDIVAMDAESGAIRWRFNAKTDSTGVPTGNCRGISYYKTPDATGLCAESVYTATVDARLIAIDAKTGAPCPKFGTNGQIDLLKGMGQKNKGYYFVTSPPQVVRGKLVIGGFVTDGQHVGEPSGVIRAFDAVTGQFAWAWDMGNPDFHGEPAEGKTYTLGTPNSWAPMSADEELGLVYVPTGNATPDYFGAFRSPAMEKYTAALVAIDAETGGARWHFQTVHHDIWDYDISVQPGLIDLNIRGHVVSAVVQATKHGQLYVLDRRTGTPIYPVHERPTPQGAVAGDWSSPTQPISSLPSFSGKRLTEADMWGATPIDQLWCRVAFRAANYRGPFTPITTQPTIVQPGFSGGTEWGSTSYDPNRRILVFLTNYIVNLNRLVPRPEMNAKGVYPATDPQTIDWGLVAQGGVPYGADTKPFQAPTGTPCPQPPYSQLTGLDLSTGKIVWSRPLGTARGIGPFGIQSGLPVTIGTPTFGGAITTAAGLTFVAASLDGSLRAFETKTGRLLWEGRLPADGLATPITYTLANGRQFVAIAVGDTEGGMRTSASEEPGAAKKKRKSTAGGTIVAFALPAG